jgi:hypothetical protein
VSIAPPRQLFQQESFSGEQHRALFREMSLGIQREAAEEGGGFFTLSPTERSLDPMAGGAPAAAAANTPAAASGAAGGRPAASGGGSGAGTPGGTPGADLAALLASPPQARHSRTFSRQGSGLSRLISKNWESDLQVWLGGRRAGGWVGRGLTGDVRRERRKHCVIFRVHPPSPLTLAPTRTFYNLHTFHLSPPCLASTTHRWI